jgi:hypothetical protein
MENAPAQNEQQAQPVNTEQTISDLYDTMAAEAVAEEVEEEVGEEVAVSEEETEETVEAESEDQEETETEVEETEEAEEQEQEEPEYQAVVPERWPQHIKEKFNKLPPEAQQMVLEDVYKPMQGTYTKATQRLAEMRKMIEPMVQSLEQYGEDFDRAGMNPAEAFRQQMAWAAHIHKVGPQQGLADMARAYNVEVPGQQADPNEEYLTPVERSLKAKLDEVQQRLDQTATGIEKNQQAQEQEALDRQRHDVQVGLHQFATAQKDGAPLHPHLEKVAPRMTGLIRGGLVSRVDDYGQPVPIQQQLGQAYKMACDMDPSIRTVRAARTRSEQVRKASNANKGVTSKRPAASVEVPDGPLTDSISDLYDKLDR